jgi:hypothetical protein
MTRFADLADIVLRPFADRPDDAWYVAPPGKWNAAQIVEHLALGLEWSAAGFEERRARDPMLRRPRTIPERVARVLVMHLGWIPSGLEAPRRAIPTPHVERAVAEARFRRGVERNLELAQLLLPARARDLFVKHPRMGDLTLTEWMDFHVVHARHHARQMRERMSP